MFYLAVLNVGSLVTAWRRGRFLHGAGLQNADIVVATEARMGGPGDLLPLWSDYGGAFLLVRPAAGGVVLIKGS